MKSLLSKALKQEFHKKMSLGLPEFQKVATAFGGYIYRKRDDKKSLNIFIFLEPDPKFDLFTVELGASSDPDFPFHILPGDEGPTGEVRYRIRTFLDHKADGWWNVNVSEARSPDFDAIMKTFEPEAVRRGLARLPQLVDQAFEQLKSVLPKFLATIR